jgi:phosphoribosylanthranilate isomerase
MALKTFVKISGVKNLSDARYCAGMGVDLLGFNIDSQSDSPMAPEVFWAITEWVSGVGIVGEFSASTTDQIQDTLKNHTVHFIETPDLALAAQFVQEGQKVILSLEITEIDDLMNFFTNQLPSHNNVSYLLLKSEKDELNEELVEAIGKINKVIPLLLGFGVNKANVIALVESGKISGIALNGGDEIKPGFKDYDELADILELLELED